MRLAVVNDTPLETGGRHGRDITLSRVLARDTRIQKPLVVYHALERVVDLFELELTDDLPRADDPFLSRLEEEIKYLAALPGDVPRIIAATMVAFVPDEDDRWVGLQYLGLLLAVRREGLQSEQ